MTWCQIKLTTKTNNYEVLLYILSLLIISLSLPLSLCTHTHTHTHTYIYIYIYEMMQFPCQKNFQEKTDQNSRQDLQLTPTQMLKNKKNN